MKSVYLVIKYFTDLQDNSHEYKENDLYPREDYRPTQDRINDLSSENNRQKTPLISEIDFNKLKVTQLKEIAERLGVKGYTDKNKAKLIEILEECYDAENV